MLYTTPDKKTSLINTKIVESVYPRSTYISPYKSNRQLAADLREEILARSVERTAALRESRLERELERSVSRRRRVSPLRELEVERQKSLARLKSEARIRALEDRVWSPSRGWVYYSPLRKSLALEAERERLRESLGLDRELKRSLNLEKEIKRSVLNSTAAKTKNSSI